MKQPSRWERYGAPPPMGRRPLRLTAAQREAWDELTRLRDNARKRVERARIRDDPRKLAEYLLRNAQEALRYRKRLSQGGG